MKMVILKDNDEEARKALEFEKELREMAQRVVIKLFNAVRAVQTKGEEGSRAANTLGL